MSRLVRLLIVPAALAALATAPAPAAAGSCCPFCTDRGETLTGGVANAALVVYGTLSDPRPDKRDPTEGTTDLNIEVVIKDHPELTDKKKLVIPKLLPVGGKYKYLVFCDVYEKKIDPYRGLAVEADAAMDKYLKGALALKDAKVPDRLLFFFDYLDSRDTEISNDAYKEFGNADYEDFRAFTRKLPREKFARAAGWLKPDAKSPGFRLGLYASMVGHGGDRANSSLLKDILDDEDRRVAMGIDGVLAAYVLLEPQAGWAYLQAALADPKQEFTYRWAAVRAVRFLYASRPEVVDRKQLAAGLTPVLAQKDIADMVVDDLRKWQRWELADVVLAMRDNEKVWSLPINRRAVLRFCMVCKGHAGAAAYLEEQRVKDPAEVMKAEYQLKAEAAQPDVPMPNPRPLK